MVASDVVVAARGSICPDVSGVLRCVGTGSSVVWDKDLIYLPVHWEDLGLTPSQGVPHTDGVATVKGTVWDMGVPLSGGGNGGGDPAGGGSLRRPPPEHSCTVHCTKRIMDLYLTAERRQ